jgi:hypothetical protein
VNNGDRNGQEYSFGITDPYANIALTGKKVLQIWNGRVNESLNEHDDLRIFIMVRNMSTLEFTLMEIEAGRYVPSEYVWKKNKNGNLLGYDKQRNEHRFTWQAGGRQFPEPVRAELRRLQNEWQSLLPPGAVRWTRPEQFHLTLKFLGNVPAAETGALSEAVTAFGLNAVPPRCQRNRY